MGRLSRAAVATAALAFVAAPGTTVAAPQAGGSLVRNGTFTAGAAGMPEGWRTEAWAADLSQFVWNSEGGEGTISIVSPKPNDARWCQAIEVQPGATYRVSAQAKTADVGPSTAGALLAVEPRIADTPDVRGTSDWRTIEVVAKAGEESTWDICPRLGSYASLNTGTAWFREVSVTLVGGAPARPGWLAQTLASIRPTGAPTWSALVIPLVGGVLLAFGFGLLGRRS